MACEDAKQGLLAGEFSVLRTRRVRNSDCKTACYVTKIELLNRFCGFASGAILASVDRDNFEESCIHKGPSGQAFSSVIDLPKAQQGVQPA
jgi:hypothetical protein